MYTTLGELLKTNEYDCVFAAEISTAAMQVDKQLELNRQLVTRYTIVADMDKDGHQTIGRS